MSCQIAAIVQAFGLMCNLKRIEKVNLKRQIIKSEWIFIFAPFFSLHLSRTFQIISWFLFDIQHIIKIKMRQQQKSIFKGAHLCEKKLIERHY